MKTDKNAMEKKIISVWELLQTHLSFEKSRAGVDTYAISPSSRKMWSPGRLLGEGLEGMV